MSVIEKPAVKTLNERFNEYRAGKCTITVIMPKELHAKFVKKTREDERSINQQVVHMIRQYVGEATGTGE